MKIADYLESTEQMKKFRGRDGKHIRDTLLQTESVWSNGACIAYCLRAMERAGFSKEDTSRVLKELWAVFEENTVEEMEELFRNGKS